LLAAAGLRAQGVNPRDATAVAAFAQANPQGYAAVLGARRPMPTILRPTRRCAACNSFPPM
jgi:hypothetical protein